MWNVSIFRKERQLLDKLDVAKMLLDEFIRYEYHPGLTKYIIKRMFETHPKSNLYKRLAPTKGFKELHTALHFKDDEDLTTKEIPVEQITSIAEDDDMDESNKSNISEPTVKKVKHN